MYIMFPIGWMYYFGTNLEERFKVPEFWPTQAQSHKIPFEKEEIRAEVQRINREIRDKARREETDRSLAQAKNVLGRAARGGGERRYKVEDDLR